MLSVAITVGLAAFFVIEVLRTLPGLRRMVRAGVKPIACDVCMSWWASATMMAGYWYTHADVGAWSVLAAGLQAAGVSLLALAAYRALDAALGSEVA